jgi:hypothetical protein
LAERVDRDRAFYPTVMIVIASYYGLFAIMGGSIQVLAFESIAIVAFLVASIAGFKRSLCGVVLKSYMTILHCPANEIHLELLG